MNINAIEVMLNGPAHGRNRSMNDAVITGVIIVVYCHARNNCRCWVCCQSISLFLYKVKHQIIHTQCAWFLSLIFLVGGSELIDAVVVLSTSALVWFMIEVRIPVCWRPLLCGIVQKMNVWDKLRMRSRMKVLKRLAESRYGAMEIRSLSIISLFIYI